MMYKLYQIVLIALLFGCGNLDRDTLNPRQYESHLKDSLIRSSIVKYAKQNKIDRNKFYLMVSIRGSAGRELIYIENNNRAFTEFSEIPSYYEIVNDYLVLYYSNLDHYLTKDKIVDELRDLVVERNMKLDSSLNLYHPNVWIIERCNKSEEIYKETWPKYKLKGVPCGYQLLRDSVKLDSLYIVKY